MLVKRLAPLMRSLYGPSKYRQRIEEVKNERELKKLRLLSRKLKNK